MFKITTKVNSIVISVSGLTILVEKNGTRISGLNTIDQKDHTFVKRIETFFNGFTSEYRKNFDCLGGICENIKDSKTLRAFSNNLRRGANEYLVANNIATNAQFQAQFFYEGVMLGRVSHGLKAAWIDENNETNVSKQKKSKENVSSFGGLQESTTPYKPYNFDMSNPWDVINKNIADRIAQEN